MPLPLSVVLACVEPPVVEATLPACPPFRRVDTVGWVAVQQPELRFLVPPVYGAPVRRTDEYSFHVGLDAPARFITMEYGSTAARLEQRPRPNGKPPLDPPLRPTCAMELGGRRARVAMWRSALDVWKAPLPERPNYRVGAYWPPVRGDSGLVVVVHMRDSAYLAESEAILASVALLNTRAP